MTPQTQEILDQIDGALDDWSVGPDAMRVGAPARQSLSPPVFPRPLLVDPAAVDAAVALFGRAMRQLAQALSRVDWPRLTAAVRAAERPDRHHPKPLRIDGHAYRRRVRSRRGRRR